MTRNFRPRRLAATLLAAAGMFALAGCNLGQYPNSTFNHTTDFNAAIDSLFDRLVFLGTMVFIIVESLLIYVVIKFRKRPGQAAPKHVHGNTTLEVLWTAIPAIILVFIAIPTVRTIFRTQAKAAPGALQVEVIGHQWWWEFRYPELNITTANELYLPAGRTVNFALKTADVIHAFWVPQLGGKRDVVANHTNYIWFTPDSSLNDAFVGNCTEYCGASHANMKFRVYTVSPAEFESWARGQQAVAAFGATPTAGQSSGPQTAGAAAAAAATARQAGVDTTGADAAARSQQAPTVSSPSAPTATAANQGRATDSVALVPGGGVATTAAAQPAGFVYPVEKMGAHTKPKTPTPATLRFDAALKGDAARGQQIYSSNSCIGCHYINGNPMSIGKVGPNLTHVGTRHTIAGGLFPNDTEHLAKWIKNARAMKPGVTMPALGKGEYDPITKQTVTTGGLTDQQIADIVAYLQALK